MAAIMDPAWQLGIVHEVGSIGAGKLADLVVLERSPFEVSPQDPQYGNSHDADEWSRDARAGQLSWN